MLEVDVSLIGNSLVELSKSSLVKTKDTSTRPRGIGMVRIIRFFFVLVLVVAPSVCTAGGTVSLAELDPLLRQKPDLRMFLISALDMSKTGKCTGSLF
jgi:hypothetical protein